MTFSITAYDPEAGAWGVAVASKFLAAGALVNWARAGCGAVATQANARVSFGPDGLALLCQGKSAKQVLQTLLAGDPNPERRQVGIVDAQGNTAVHTGVSCQDWAGHLTGDGFTCQGNILVGEAVIQAMAGAFTAAKGELSDRLLSALMAGDTAGGDKRGKQSAALLVVRTNGGYGGDNDRYIDLRVDDDEEPVRRLRKLVMTHHLFFSPPKKDDQLKITAQIAAELQQIMINQGYFGGVPNGEWDEMSQQAFWALVANENLEERWHIDSNTNTIDRVALDYLRERFK